MELYCQSRITNAHYRCDQYRWGCHSRVSLPSRFLAFILGLLQAWLIWAGSGTGLAAAPPAGANQFKAVFLLNFVQFVEWPTNIHSAANSPIIIGIAGQDPFGPLLEEVLKDEKIGGHPLVPQRFKPEDDPGACQVLFISASESGRFQTWLEKVKGRPVLTVSDLEGFAQQGGMINFVIEGKKLRFQINPSQAAQAGLKISSKLLRLALVVEHEAPPKTRRKP